MKSFNTYIQQLNEGSLARLYNHIVNYECLIISAYRGSHTGDENDEVTQELLDMVKIAFAPEDKNAPCGPLRLIGTYEEIQPKDEEGNREKKIVKEVSWLIPNFNYDYTIGGDFVAWGKSIGERFNQDSILHIEKGGERAFEIGCKERFKEELNITTRGFGSISFAQDTNAEVKSKIKNKIFTFNNAEEQCY